MNVPISCDLSSATTKGYLHHHGLSFFEYVCILPIVVSFSKICRSRSYAQLIHAGENYNNPLDPPPHDLLPRIILLPFLPHHA